ncbi:MAG: ABC transporter permease [Thalassotalea sp.]
MIKKLSHFSKPALIWLIALALLIPVVVMLLAGISAPTSLFSHLWQTVLPDYLFNTVALGLLVVVLSLCFGIPSALFVSYFPLYGKQALRWLLLLPLAMPAYLVAYLYTDLFDYAGPIQRALRLWFEWQSPSDYWFFDIRTLTGAGVVIALVLYPYVYMLARTAFEQQDQQLLRAGRTLGLSPKQTLLKIALPLARPAIAVAASLVLMETLADFATVQYFAVNTLTTAVYDTWLGYGDLAAANALASILLFFVFVVVVLEQKSRQGMQHQSNNPNQQKNEIPLAWWSKTLASGFCWLLVFAGFLLPLALLIDMAIVYSSAEQITALLDNASNSIVLSLYAATITLIFALLFSFYQRFNDNKLASWPLRLSGLGYAIPGTVLAMAMMATFSPLDHWINDLAKAFGYQPPGLILSGTIFAIIFAFVVRFAAIANGTITAGLKQIPVSLDKAAASLGVTRSKTLWQVHRKLLQSSMFVAWLLVFVEAMKELPAVLLLRPFNYETLSTQVYQLISDEMLEHGALGAILIVLFGLIPIIWLNREKVNA